MTLDQLHSLTEEELLMLLYIVNNVPTRILTYEISPNLLCSIRDASLLQFVIDAEKDLTDSGKSIHSSLKNKLGITQPPAEAPITASAEAPITASAEAPITSSEESLK